MSSHPPKPLDDASPRPRHRTVRQILLIIAVGCLLIGIDGGWTAWQNFGEFDTMPVPGRGPPASVVQRKEKARREFLTGACIGIFIGVFGLVLLRLSFSKRAASDD